MRKTWKGLRAVAVMGGLALLIGLAACNRQERLTAGERTIYMAAVEPKGTTNVAKEPFPAKALPAGGGYGLKEPDADGNWTVETYSWSPASITVFKDDRVRLEIIGINGAEHPVRIEGYNLDFTVKRGEVTTVRFLADKAGIFPITCAIHQPAMTGTLIVLPR